MSKTLGLEAPPTPTALSLQAAARLMLAALVVTLYGGGPAARAEPAGDPPARVGRLAYIEGTVSFRSADQEQWAPATRNLPVTSGQSYWTEPNARAEVQVGGAELRVDQSTEIDVVRLDDNATVLGLSQGTINVHLRTAPPGGVQVRTPRGQVSLLRQGSYHLEVGASGDASAQPVTLAVLEGEARMEAPRATLIVRRGERATFTGDPMTAAFAEADATPFDDWALQRERREAAAGAPRYVSPETTGYQDLDANGHWQSVPSYGPVWYPQAVPQDWAPYRYGHWAYVRPWGWTWIDDAPWGFAPFHYGRWVVIDGVWAWVPGVIVPRPVYAPALVAFVGGPDWGASLSGFGAFAAVGWIPLAPFEVFHPCYRASVPYVRNINITNVNRTVINNITTVNVINAATVTRFANQHAATVVPARAFTRGEPAQQTSLALPHEQLAHAPIATRIDHLSPSATARAGIAAPATPVNPPGANVPAQIVSGRGFANAPPPAAQPAAPPIAPGPAMRSALVAPRPAAPTPPAASRSAAPGATSGVLRDRAAMSHRSAPAPQSPPPPASAPAARPQPSAAPAAARMPLAAPQRPVQQTQLHPTLQGWQRQPMPPHQAAPAQVPPAQGRGPAHPNQAPGSRPHANEQRQGG